MFHRIKLFIKGYWVFYIIGFILILGVKYFYSDAGSSDLEWILSPTAWWVSFLSGIPFEKVPQVGYVNHQLRFIIAPSCSGIQFMIITFATLLFSFVHRMGTVRRGFCWMASSLGFSYFFTIFVNGFRIIFSIYFSGQDIDGRWMTPERIHTMEGTVIYFSSLFILYHIAGYVSRIIAYRNEGSVNSKHLKYPGTSFTQRIGIYIPPMFWYLSITVGIPFLNRAYKNNGDKFIEYAMFVSAISLGTTFLFYMLSILRERSGKQKKL